MDDSRLDFYLSFPTRDLLLHYKHYLKEFLPDHLKSLKITASYEDSIIADLELIQKELAQVNSHSIEKLVNDEIERYNTMIKSVNASMTDNQINMCKNVNEKINQLREWQPLNESSTYLKTRFLKQLEDRKNYLLYGCTEIHSKYTYELAYAKIIENKIKLLEKIRDLEYLRSFMIEYTEKLESYERHLTEDLELMS